MTQPVVIAVAITCDIPRKKDSAAVPFTSNDQIGFTQDAFAA